MAPSPALEGLRGGGGATALLPETHVSSAGTEVDRSQPVRRGSSSFTARGAFVASISSMLFGYCLSEMNTIAPYVVLTFGWCEQQGDGQPTISCARSELYESLVNAILFVGAAVGAYATGPLLARPSFPARRVLCLSASFFVLGGALAALATGVGMLLVARLFKGVGVGICTVCGPLYISEMSPPGVRGFYASMTNFAIQVGIFCAISFGLGQTVLVKPYRLSEFDRFYWRGIVGFPVLPGLLQLLGFLVLFRYDSPQWLVAQGKSTQAQSVLLRMHDGDMGAVEAEMGLLLQRIAESPRSSSSSSVAATRTSKVPLCRAFFDPYFRFALLVGLFVATLMQLCGMNAVCAYSNRLFSEAGIAAEDLTLASTCIASISILGSYLCCAKLDVWGRRNLLLGGTSLQGLSLMGALGVLLCGGSAGWAAWASVVLVVLYSFGFSFGLGAITWVYLSEIFPSDIRGQAMGFCGLVNWLSCCVVVGGARFLDEIGTFATFGTLCCLGAVGTFLWVLDTTGCDREDSPVSPRERRRLSGILREMEANNAEEEPKKQLAEVTIAVGEGPAREEKEKCGLA